MRALELTILVLATLLGECLAAASPKAPTAAERGLDFAGRNCAVCHGVTKDSRSPNPEAPTWDDIVNHSGTSEATLRLYLRDSHNFPRADELQRR